MRNVARPTWRGNSEQKRLLKALVNAIEHSEEAARREEAKVLKAAREARAAGIPDAHIIRATGWNRSTFQRRLGPRPENTPGDESAAD